MPEAAWPLQAALPSRHSGDAREGRLSMVAPTVRHLWQLPVRCDARRLLYSAQEALARGSTIEAGCRLKAALRSWLQAECNFNACAPKPRGGRPRRPSTRSLAVALRKAGHCSPALFEAIVDIIKIGDETVRLVAIRPDYVSAAICLMHLYLDGSPYLVESKQGARV